MAGLNPSEISIPIRKLFGRAKNVFINLTNVEDVDDRDNRLFYDGSWHKFDYIVLACGSKHSYFGQNRWEKHAPGLKNIEQATEIRRRVLSAFEEAEKIDSPKRQCKHLSFCIVGGGPTGVELAGGIAEMASRTLKQDYKIAKLENTKVYLIEAGPRILAAFPETLSTQAQKDLEGLGVIVKTKTQASDISEDGLKIGDEYLECKTIIWAAGVEPESLVKKLTTEKTKFGKVKVRKDLSLPKNKNFFAVGDIAEFYDKENKELPGVAPVAIQQGEFVGKLIQKEVNRNKKRGEFKYFDKGIMATIGRSKAVISSRGINLHGFPAWIAWVFIHILYLLRFRNKLFVLLQWSWSYFNFGNGARLIVSKKWQMHDTHNSH
jgi:NADH dehydrogenase